MKNYLLMMIVVLSVLSVSVMGEIITKQLTGSRHPIQTGNIVDINQMNTVNFTCGNDGTKRQDVYVEDVIDDSSLEISVWCSDDSTNTKGRVLIIDEGFAIKDQVEVTSPNFALDISDASIQSFEFTDYQGDSDQELIVYYKKDAVGVDKKLSLIIYEWDGSEYIFYDEIVLVNDSSNFTINGWEHIDPDDDSALETMMDCLSDWCIISGNYYAMKINLSDRNISWFQDYSEVNAGFTNPLYSMDYFFEPAIIDNELDGELNYNVISPNEDIFLSFNVSDGSVQTNLSITAGSGPVSWSFELCDASRCPDDEYVMVIGQIGGSEGCRMYDITDGTQIQYTDVDVALSAEESLSCFVLDIDGDEDADDELCAVSLQTQDVGHMRCETLNLFEQDIVDVTLQWNNVSDTLLDSYINPNVWMIDYDADGQEEFIVAGTVWDLGNATDITGGTVNHSSIYLDDAISVVPVETFSYPSRVSDTNQDVWIFDVMMNTDVIYVSTSGETSFQAQFTGNGPFNQIQSPVCNDSYLTFTCSYANGCISDFESDEIKMHLDCFSDGTQVFTDTRFTTSGLQDIVGCDTSQATIGIQNATFTVWDEEHDQDENDTIVVQYAVADASLGNCFNNTNTGEVDEGEVVNTPPSFISLPDTSFPQPYCNNTSIVFACEEGTCYSDAEGDPVRFRVDCDNDGVYEEQTILSHQDSFVCRFNSTTGSRQINVQVQDNFNPSLWSDLSFTVEVSSLTVEDVLNTGTASCSDEYLFDDEGNFIQVDNATSPFFILGPQIEGPHYDVSPRCSDEPITYTCRSFTCYSFEDLEEKVKLLYFNLIPFVPTLIPLKVQMMNDIPTYLKIDLEGDGVDEYVIPFLNDTNAENLFIPEINKLSDFEGGFIKNLNFKKDADFSQAFYNNTSNEWYFNTTFEIVNDLGFGDVIVEEVVLSNDSTICLSQDEVEREEFESLNGVQKVFFAWGNAVFLSMSILGWIFLIASTGIIFYGGYNKDMKETPMIATVWFFAVGTGLSIFGVISVIFVVVSLIVALGLIAFKFFGGTGG